MVLKKPRGVCRKAIQILVVTENEDANPYAPKDAKTCLGKVQIVAPLLSPIKLYPTTFFEGFVKTLKSLNF